MREILDGNKACARVSYKFTEVSGIYPITPASPIAENIENMSTSGEKNYFGESVKVVEMQSEAGAIGAVHGMLQNGVLQEVQGLPFYQPHQLRI